MPRNKPFANSHALKHGLARSVRRDPGFTELVDGLALALAGETASFQRTYKANRLAEAVAAIQRLAATEVAAIETARRQITGGSSLYGDSDYAAAIAAANVQLMKLERYKREAFVNYLKTSRAYLHELEMEEFKP
jgi:hypothetical protein